MTQIIYDSVNGVPIWAWIVALVVFLHLVALAAAILWPMVFKGAVSTVRVGDTNV